MTKKIKKIVTMSLFSIILTSGIVASAGTITSYGNRVTKNVFTYGSAWTGTSGTSWASVAVYDYDVISKRNYLMGSNRSASGWAQTATLQYEWTGVPAYSTHSCDSYTIKKSM